MDACISDEAAEAVWAGAASPELLAAAENHADRCPRCRDLLVAIGRILVASRVDAAGSGPEADVPRRLGRYVLAERLGAGAMGVVYAAHDASLGRRVAIKVVRTGTRAPVRALAARLVREARALARLSHPNVVSVYDVGELRTTTTAMPLVFVVMELVHGRTLAAWLHEQRPGWRKIVDAFVQAGRGLQAAHEAGLVHRDFKPGNVLVDTHDRVRVGDFGLVRLHAEDESTLHDATRPADLSATGIAIGTPAYMAPEQHVGGRVDARSDQYAFCVALFEALYGARPFVENNVAALALAKARGRIVETPLRSGPAALLDALRRGLAADPARRWPSMLDLLEALQRIRRRRRAPWIAAVAVLLTIPLLLVPVERSCSGRERLAGVWDEARARAVASPEPIARLDRYAAQWSDSYERACTIAEIDRRDAVMACLQRRRTELDATVRSLAEGKRDAMPRALEAVDALGAIDSCERVAIDSRARRNPAEAAEAEAIAVRLSRARAVRAIGQPAAAHEFARDALAHAISLGDPSLVAESRLELGLALIDHDALVPAHDELVAAFEAAREAGHDGLAADAATRLIWVLTTLGSSDAGLEWARHAHALLDRSRVGHRRLYTRLLTHEADALARSGREREAEDVYLAAIEVDTGVDSAMAHNNYGTLLALHGRAEEALTQHRIAHASFVARLGPSHRHVAMAQINIAAASMLSSEYAEAEVALAGAEAILLATVGERDSLVAEARMRRAEIRAKTGDRAQGLRDVASARAIFADIFGRDSGAVAETWMVAGGIELMSGDLVAAEASLRRAIGSFDLIRDDVGSARARTNLARVEAHRGAFVDAERDAREAIDGAATRAGVWSASTLESLAMALLGQGRADEALPLIDDALASNDSAWGRFLRLRAQWELAIDRPRVHRELEELAASVGERAATSFELARIVAWVAEHPEP